MKTETVEGPATVAAATADVSCVQRVIVVVQHQHGTGCCCTPPCRSITGILFSALATYCAMYALVFGLYYDDTNLFSFLQFQLWGAVWFGIPTCAFALLGILLSGEAAGCCGYCGPCCCSIGGRKPCFHDKAQPAQRGVSLMIAAVVICLVAFIVELFFYICDNEDKFGDIVCIIDGAVSVVLAATGSALALAGSVMFCRVTLEQPSAKMEANTGCCGRGKCCAPTPTCRSVAAITCGAIALLFCVVTMFLGWWPQSNQSWFTDPVFYGFLPSYHAVVLSLICTLVASDAAGCRKYHRPCKHGEQGCFHDKPPSARCGYGLMVAVFVMCVVTLAMDGASFQCTVNYEWAVILPRSFCGITAFLTLATSVLALSSSICFYNTVAREAKEERESVAQVAVDANQVVPTLQMQQIATNVAMAV